MNIVNVNIVNINIINIVELKYKYNLYINIVDHFLSVEINSKYMLKLYCIKYNELF